jgi:sugar lactone lactonase YvrE
MGAFLVVVGIAAAALGQAVTQVRIDGHGDDWASYKALLNDSQGDNNGGAFDIASISAFTNDLFLYVLIRTTGARGACVQIDLDILAGTRHFIASFSPDEGGPAALGEIRGNTFAGIGVVEGSVGAAAEVVEFKMPLAALGNPTSATLRDVRPMAGTCCEDPAWYAIDQTSPVSVPHVDEVEPVPSDDEQYVLARQFQLPEGYVVQNLFSPPAPNLVGIANSMNGTVYLIYGGLGLSAGIATLDPISGKVTPVLDLPRAQGWFAAIVGGPQDTAFIPMRDEIWQVWPDGSHKVWSSASGGARPKYYSADGHLLASSVDGTRVMEFSANGGGRVIASGFAGIYDVVSLDDGTVFVTDTETGNVVRVDSDGSQHVLATGVLFRDPMDLGVAPDGNVYMMSVVTGFVKVDNRTGRFTRYDSADCPCTSHPLDFVFNGGRVLFIDPAASQITWVNLTTGKNGLLVSNGGANSRAMDIGPDGALYVGTAGCRSETSAQVVRIDDDGTRQVYVDGLRGEVQDIAFAPGGGLYIATNDRERGVSQTFYVASNGSAPREIQGANGLSSLAVDSATGHLFASRAGSSSVLEFSTTRLLAEHAIRLPKPPWDFIIAFAPDGILYAYASEEERAETGPTVNRWLLRLDVLSGSSESVFQFDHEGCCVMGNLAVDPQRVIWWLVNPEKLIYRVSPDGSATLFAQNLPVDPKAIAVDAQGDVYITSPGGIYRIYREP